MEELEAELAKLERRCRSAEQEVDAQKELINVSEETGSTENVNAYTIGTSCLAC